ncbi:hypothetical protein AAEX28_07130 [Lentisphaerota bacterium WC36G]|nr:hypothetical protein LJT99_09995 [Lentisphaerae bacterium WC36]
MSNNDLERRMLQPKKIIKDGEEIENHSLKDQIALDNHLTAKRNAKRNVFGVRSFKISSPGAS